MEKMVDTGSLGAIYQKEATTFRLWAPGAQAVVLHLYRTGSDREEGAQAAGEYVLFDLGEGVWECSVFSDLHGIYYDYVITRDGKKVRTADPYAKACGVNGQRSMVVDLSETNPEGFMEEVRPVIEEKDIVIYELHIRDFSIDPASGIKKEFRGKYKAFTQKDTTLDGKGEFPTCLSYLKKLGITYVHLLPAFDYASVDEEDTERGQFNWGYDPLNYNVPEGSYSTDAFHGEVRIREFKEMVQALHEEGICVVMDVVYNHTYSADSWLERCVPGYYYRKNPDGSFSNGSLCGNETASEHEMFRKYMIDSVCYWAKEYHIDGFRFDLMGLHDVETMNAIRGALDELPDGKRILMYGEPWFAKEPPMEEGAVPAIKANLHLLDERIAVFCDSTRDAVKGSVFSREIPGYANAALLPIRPVDLEGKIAEGMETPEKYLDVISDIRHSVTAWCDGEGGFLPKAPRQIINYVSAHDNYTLWDKLVFTSGKESFSEKYEDLLEINQFCAGIVFTCQGIPFFQAGEEFARTKQGVGDSYCSPDTINRLDWKRASEYRELVSYYRDLIALRKKQNGFGSFEKPEPEKVAFLQAEKESVLGFLFEKQKMVVYYNPEKTPEDGLLPEGDWKLLFDRSGICDGKEQIFRETVRLMPKSVVILQKKER